MATQIAEAYVQIKPSTKGIKNELSQQLGGEVSAAGDSAGTALGNGIVGKLKGILAAAGIGTIIKQTLDAGGAVQQSFGGLDTIYGDASEAAKKYARDAVSAGISMNNYAEQAVSFGASLKKALGGDVQKSAEMANLAIMDMADNAAKMGTPLESIQNAYQGLAKGNATMLDNLKIGYGGTQTEMLKLAKDMGVIDKSVKSFGDMSFDQSIMAIHKMQEELGITGVAAQEAKTTFTGSMEAMKASVENLLADIALGNDISDDLYNVFSTGFTFVVDNLAPMVGNIVQAIPELLNAGLSQVIRSMNILSNNMDVIVADTVNVISGIIETVVSNAPYFIESAINLIGSIFSAIMSIDWGAKVNELLTNIMNNFAVASGEIFGNDTSLVDNFMLWIQNALPTFVEGVGNMLVSFIENVMVFATNFYTAGAGIGGSIIAGIMSTLAGLIESMSTILQNLIQVIIDNLPAYMEAGMQMLMSLVMGIVENLPQIVEAVLNLIVSFINTIIENLPQIIAMGMEMLVQLGIGLVKAIPGLLVSVAQIIAKIIKSFNDIKWSEIGVNIIRGIIEGLKATAHELWDWLTDMAKQALNKVKEVLGINSPSEEFKNQVGHWIPAGIAVGVKGNMSELNSTMEDLSRETLTPFDKANMQIDSFDKPKDNNSNLVGAIAQLNNQLVGEIQQAFANGFDVTWNDRQLGRLVNTYAR